MTSPFLVTGGTGTLGRLVVPRLRDAGAEARVLSRRPHEPADGVELVVGDLATGEGLDAAVDGIGTIVHCGGSARGDDDKARNLVRAAARADAQHLVFISVVGADRVPVESGLDRAMFGYFAAKRAAEQVVADSGLPWTTPGHPVPRPGPDGGPAAGQAAGAAGPGRRPLPAGRRRRGGARLAELALGPPSGLVPDVGGPRNPRRAPPRLPAGQRPAPAARAGQAPGRAARAVRAGAHLAPERAVGRRTWEDFLAERLG